MVDVLERVIADLQQLREQQKTDDAQQLARSTAEFQAISSQQQNQLKEYERRITELEQALADKNNELSYKLALTLSLANVAHEALLVINEKRQIIAIND